MSLPKLKYPTFTIEIPSMKKKVKFRRFLVAEEKMLLMARESDSESTIAEAVRDVIDSCCQEDLDIGKFKPFDMDYVFMKLRAESVDNVIKVNYTPDEDDPDNTYKFLVSLDEVEIPAVDSVKATIRLDEQYSVEMEYPSIEQIINITALIAEKQTEHKLEDLVMAASIKRVFDQEGEEFQADTEEEIFEFLDQISPKPYGEMTDFLDGIPELTHTITYKKENGEEDEVVLSGLLDFFIF